MSVDRSDSRLEKLVAGVEDDLSILGSELGFLDLLSEKTSKSAKKRESGRERKGISRSDRNEVECLPTSAVLG